MFGLWPFVRGPIAGLACVAVAGAASTTHAPTRAELLGAWRLVRIEYLDARGPVEDPYYAPDSIGSLIYEAGGNMSVHITQPHRGEVKVPSNRRSAPLDAAGTLARAKAFDTYYAYFGRWDYDREQGIVTHHVQGSLIPEETGISYAQRVSLEGEHLIFTNEQLTPTGKITRRKIWERVSDAG